MSCVKVTFVEDDGNVRTIEDADVSQTLMQVGRSNGVKGILAECGGGCSCATCHVYVDPEWAERVGPPNDIESEMLDMVGDLQQQTSRLSCQIQLSEELDGLKVTVAPVP